MTDLKHLMRRSEDEFPLPSPVMAALLGGICLGGFAVFFAAVVFIGATS